MKVLHDYIQNQLNFEHQSTKQLILLIIVCSVIGIFMALLMMGWIGLYT